MQLVFFNISGRLPILGKILVAIPAPAPVLPCAVLAKIAVALRAKAGAPCVYAAAAIPALTAGHTRTSPPLQMCKNALCLGCVMRGKIYIKTLLPGDLSYRIMTLLFIRYHHLKAPRSGGFKKSPAVSLKQNRKYANIISLLSVCPWPFS